MNDTAAAAAGARTLARTRIRHEELLVEALTHPSAARRRGGARRGYERLEFLGDRVLGLVVAELLWRRFPNEAEGELTRRHTHLVRHEALAEVAQAVGLGPRLIVSAGEDAAGVRDNPSVLADVCEAVIAALYLDGGLAVAARFCRALVGAGWPASVRRPRDPKTALQEWAQARGLPLPAYRTVATEGPGASPPLHHHGVGRGRGAGDRQRYIEARRRDRRRGRRARGARSSAAEDPNPRRSTPSHERCPALRHDRADRRAQCGKSDAAQTAWSAARSRSSPPRCRRRGRACSALPFAARRSSSSSTRPHLRAEAPARSRHGGGGLGRRA